MVALQRHGSRVRQQDRVAIADFSLASSQLRFHLVDLHNGVTRSLLVSHGIGSDPKHTSMLQRFSNEVGSEATCEGAFLASNYYVGQHQLSQRLIGLDPTNNNALDRAIVIHGAWYSNPDMITKHGKLGRSQGCFAVAEMDLEKLFSLLGRGPDDLRRKGLIPALTAACARDLGLATDKSCTGGMLASLF